MTARWRYQRKEGWGDIWRHTYTDPASPGFFEAPDDWRWEAADVFFCPVLGSCPHWLDRCKPVGCQHPEAVEARSGGTTP